MVRANPGFELAKRIYGNKPVARITSVTDLSGAFRMGDHLVAVGNMASNDYDTLTAAINSAQEPVRLWFRSEWSPGQSTLLR